MLHKQNDRNMFESITDLIDNFVLLQNRKLLNRIEFGGTNL